MPILINKTDPQAPNARFEKPSPLLIGTAGDADLQLEIVGVSAHHCWIERHHDGYHVVDLNTTNGTHVNGRRVSEVLLVPGDVLRLGKAEFEFQLTEAEKTELEALLAKQNEPSQLVRFESVPPAPGGTTAVDFARRCPQCGVPVGPGVNFCPRCGLSTSAVARPLDQFVQPVEGVGIRGPGILPMLALICGLVGPLLFGIGWLLGIILGLMALAIIRRTGGFERDRRQALWGVGAGIIWAVVLFATIGGWLWTRSEQERRLRLDKQIAENEQATVAELANLARAEKYAKTVLFLDANHNNIGEYLKLPQLDKLESSFVNHALAQKGIVDGYRFNLVDATESRFVATAEPQRQGATGRRVFSVDQTGVLRGADLGPESDKNASYWRKLFVKARVVTFNPLQLPPLRMPNAFEGADDEIADDALAVARSLAKSGDYEKSRAILDYLRQSYTLTKAATQLTDLEKTIDPFIVEARADRRFRDALAAREKGDLVLAIALLKDVSANYSTFSKIHDATRLLQELQVQYAQSQEDKAKTLFEKAEALERDGKMSEAETVYFQIERGYPDTEWAKQVLSIKPALQQQLREKQVEGWLQQLSSLSPESDYTQILNLIEQLRRNYSDTTAYREATDSTGELQSLKILEQKALAQRLKVDAARQVQAGQPRRALTSLEKAIEEKPDLTVYLREPLWDLYPSVAGRMLAEHDASGAMALYEKFLKLNPPEGKLDRRLFADLSYQVGQSDLLGGRAEAALPRLQQAEAVYRNDPEFNATYGRTLCRLGKYEDAIERFNAAGQQANAVTTPILTTLYFWRAWAWLHWAELLEKDVREAAELPTLAEVQNELSGYREARNLDNASPAKPGATTTNQAAQSMTNLTITIAQPTTPSEAAAETGARTNVFETLLSGSLELVADIEAARVDFSRQELTSHGKGDKVEISTRFDKAQRIQQFRDRVSKLRQLMLGEREHQSTIGEKLQKLLDAYTKAQADLERGAKVNDSSNPLLAQNGRLVLPKMGERAELYRGIVPALIRARRDDLRIAETSLDLAEQSINQLQWNLKGGLNISKAVEENFRRVGSRKALDEAVALFHRFDEKKLDLAELWRRNSLPEP